MDHVPRVKICGITNLEDAGDAVRCGADALGFLVGLLYPTADQLAPEEARDLVRAMPVFVSSVLVTHQSEPKEVVRLLEVVRPTTVQLHGEFSPQAIPHLRERFPHLKVVKAVHVVDERSVELALEVGPHVDAVLLDTRTRERLGGTGLTHDWSISRRIRSALRATPVILAGGLNPGNVGAAIASVEPYGVDVNTGVSAYPGKKSAALVGRFVVNAKAGALGLSDPSAAGAEAAAVPAATPANSTKSTR